MSTTYENAIATAETIGRDHGRAAGSWVTDGNTTAETYRRLLKGISDIDPEVMDSLPSAPLSGEWADSYSLSDLSADTDVSQDSDMWDDVCTAYEMAYSDAVVAEVERACRANLVATGGEEDYCHAHDLFWCWFAH